MTVRGNVRSPTYTYFCPLVVRIRLWYHLHLGRQEATERERKALAKREQPDVYTGARGVALRIQRCIFGTSGLSTPLKKQLRNYYSNFKKSTIYLRMVINLSFWHQPTVYSPTEWLRPHCSAFKNKCTKMSLFFFLQQFFDLFLGSLSGSVDKLETASRRRSVSRWKSGSGPGYCVTN